MRGEPRHVVAGAGGLRSASSRVRSTSRELQLAEGATFMTLCAKSTLISLSCRRRRSFNRRTSLLNTARRRSISPQSSARSDPQRWMPPPTAPTADAPMHDRPPSDGSPASPAAAARAAADPVPLTIRTSNDNFEVAGFGQVQPPPACLHVHASRPFPPLTPPYTVGEGHDYPPGRRSHQQVTQAPTPGRLRLTTKPCSGCSSIKTATPTAGPWASSSPRMRCES